MPEMLEIEFYRRLADRALDREITKVKVPDKSYPRGSTTSRALSSALVGSRFAAARRHGKLLVLETGGPPLGLRFGMTGILVVDGNEAVERLEYGPAVQRREWVRFGVGFADGGALEIVDPRRLGSVELAPDESKMGPDALVATTGQLRQALSSRHPNNGPPLKARLQDQAHLAGLGNLLSDEILWRASLAPDRPSGSLSDTELRRLHRQIGATLSELLERGGSHMGDLMPERRLGGHCPKDGTPLRRTTVGGRTSWWCPKHQR